MFRTLRENGMVDTDDILEAHHDLKNTHETIVRPDALEVTAVIATLLGWI